MRKKEELIDKIDLFIESKVFYICKIILFQLN